jgi:holo-[acyl-carrier protein] synthase
MTRQTEDEARSERADAGPDASGPESKSEADAAASAPPGAGGIDVGVGIDVVAVERVAEALDRIGTRFLDRALTAAEREYCRERADPAQHVAARWAAKEAAAKALPDGDAPVRMGDVEVTREKRSGAPGLSFASGAATAARAFGGGAEPGRSVSLSHDRRAGIAAAVVVLTSGDGTGARAVREEVAAHAATGLPRGERGATVGAGERLDHPAHNGEGSQ